jgi:hypothetical protein
MKKSTTPSATTNTTNTNTTSNVVVKEQPKLSPNYLAKLKAEEDMRKADAPKPTQTPIEQAMKIVKANTTTTTTPKEEQVKTTTNTTTPSAEKKPNSRAVPVTEKDANHFGIVVGDVCTLVEVTNGTTLTAQVTSHYYNKDNNRSATHLTVLDAEGNLTKKKINVYTIRLTKVSAAPKAEVKPDVKPTEVTPTKETKVVVKANNKAK